MRGKGRPLSEYDLQLNQLLPSAYVRTALIKQIKLRYLLSDLVDATEWACSHLGNAAYMQQNSTRSR